MIKELSLINWKSFSDAHLWIDPLTFIIGANAAGKSNIVDALAFLAYSASGGRFSTLAQRGGAEGLIKREEHCAKLGVIVSSSREEFVYRISVTLRGKEILLQEESLEQITEAGEKLILYSTVPEGADVAELPVRILKEKKDGMKERYLRRDVSILSQMESINAGRDIKEKAESVKNVLRDIFVLDPKPEKMRGYSAVSDRLESDGSNIAGVLASLPEERKRELEKTLTDYVRPLPEKDLIRIWAEPVGLFRSDAMLYCTEEWVNGQKTEFDARAMSDGTLRFIAIVAGLLLVKEGATVVIEEVDNGLHPSRTGKLVEALKELGRKRNIGIICTTHNPVLIDALGSDMMPSISYVSRNPETGGSEVAPMEEVPGFVKLLAGLTPGGMMVKDVFSNTASKR